MPGCNDEARRDSQGRRHLLILLRSTTRRELAARLGVKRATVGHWATGRHAPDAYAIRQKCRDELGILPDEWDRPGVNDTAEPPPASSAQAG